MNTIENTNPKAHTKIPQNENRIRSGSVASLQDSKEPSVESSKSSEVVNTTPIPNQNSIEEVTADAVAELRRTGTADPTVQSGQDSH